INFELPNQPETYVHRIGRTGRAGLSGTAWSFCDAEEGPYLQDINKLTTQTIPMITDHPYAVDMPALSASSGKRKEQGVKKAAKPFNRNKRRKSPLSQNGFMYA